MPTTSNREPIYERLQALGIAYELTEHPPVWTVDEIVQYGLHEKGEVCKNLFLRDYKGRRHFLVTLHKDKHADLAAIREQLGCTRLSFASPERLMKYLGVVQGEVSPLAIVHDTEAEVEVVFDDSLQGCERLGVHPGDNTATVWLSWSDLRRFVEHNGNDIRLIKI